jgi:excisionase family DNA binding protein
MAKPVPQTTLPELIDLPAVAFHLGVSPRHVRRLVAERRIPFVKWGHLLRFDPVEIAEWLDAKRRPDGRPSRGVASGLPRRPAPGRAVQTRWELE